MWLLNACSWELRDFISDKDTPPYAILSHTWGEEEVSFKDWETQPATRVEKKKGFPKIDYCCAQAVSDGYEWVWIDTCCIDKSSSAELSEAINSMFRWYRNAEICYAYLADTSEVSIAIDIQSALSQCRWVTRGWTVQELLAPREVIFYSQNWKLIGSRTELSSHLANVTGIQIQYLEGRSLGQASIAHRMSWASRRTTSREEDMAYCLLGIFDVNMTLLYGEGKRAFRRLQEILAHEYYKDHTLYAWGEPVSSLSEEMSISDARKWKPPKHDPSKHDHNFYGLLARSPEDFQNSGNIVSSPDAETMFTGLRDGMVGCSPPTFIGQSAQIKLPYRGFVSCTEVSMTDPPITQLKPLSSIYLLCGRWDGPHEKFLYVVIPIYSATNGHCTRLYQLLIDEVYAFWPDMTSDSFSPLIRQLTVEPLIPKGLENGDILLRKRVLNTWETSYLVTSNSVSALLSDHIRLLEPVDSTIECYVHRLNENVCIAYGYSRPGSLTSRKSTPIIGLSVFIKSTKSVTESVRIRSTKRSTGATFEDTPPTLVFTSSAGAADYYFRGREKFTYLERMAVPCDEWIFEVVNANNESIGSIRIGTERKFYNFENADGGPADVGSEGYVDVVDFCVWSDWDGKHQVMRDPDMEKGSRHKIG